MLLVAVLLSAVHTQKPGSSFYELHLAELRDDGRAFSPLSAAFFGLLFEVEAHWYGVMPIHLDILWSYTSCLRARVRNNNNQTTTTTKQQQQQQRRSVAQFEVTVP